MLIPYALQTLYHRQYALLVQNTWMIQCLKERLSKRDKRSRVNIYTSRIFFIQKKVIFKGYFSPQIDRTIYEIKDAPHKQTIQKETNNNRSQYTYMWIKIYNKKTCEERDIKNTHFTQSGHLLRCCVLPVNHCFCYHSQHPLLLTVFAIFTTYFAALTKHISISNHHQLYTLIDN